jgi:hypothetical protein
VAGGSGFQWGQLRGGEMRETGEKGRGWGDGTIMDERRSAGGDPSEEQGGGATGEIRQRRGSSKGRRQERCGPAG